MPTVLRKFIRRLRYPGSARYWEKRYAHGGHSGSGSSGALAEYKARVVNDFVVEMAVNSITELGCGDGQQLALAHYPVYCGLDIAPTAVNICRKKFNLNQNFHFAVYHPESFNPADYQSDMALSMEVVFHLTEQKAYRLYMQHLFACARRWVVIFSANEPDTTGGVFPHFKPRVFTQDIPDGWALRHCLTNPHRDLSISDFYFFEKQPFSNDEIAISPAHRQ